MDIGLDGGGTEVVDKISEVVASGSIPISVCKTGEWVVEE